MMTARCLINMWEVTQAGQLLTPSQVQWRSGNYVNGIYYRPMTATG